ncbi:MAG: hypothetical protein JRN20_18660 [Nitrososphaerota archaeon]|jgi:hypothetical protein|nr:hypothetical protein [Nitrososphaerota archaeon]MDG6922062.1 hypothetical protein [Nitrososphaerota archaeon]
MGTRKGDKTKGIPPEDLELWAKLLSLGKELQALRIELETYHVKVRRALLDQDNDGVE